MQTFHCQCGNRIFFENTRCNVCGRMLGYLVEPGLMSALEPSGDIEWRALAPSVHNARYRMCAHYARDDVCNWMVPAEDCDVFCQACRLNQTIPDLNQPKHLIYWAKIEAAKRRLLYTLYQLGLPVTNKKQDPEHGLAFSFLADADSESEFTDPIAGQHSIATGHAGGLITINLAEADDIARTRMRERMNEDYRTLLGHFRHEIGHYYWELLVRDQPRLDAFRKLYGDERLDYNQALQDYYQNGPPNNWQANYISAYATAHPWEDWSESWAHYLFMIDTLETAKDFGFAIQGREVAPFGTPQEVNTGNEAFSHARHFDVLLEDWVRLTIAINAINRSMGLRDAYPFVLSAPARDKLHFVHEAIISQAES